MKLAVTGDIHFSAYAQDTTIDGLPERLGSIKNSLDGMVEECIKRKINTIAIAGDLTHNKSIIHTTAQNVMLEFFEKYERSDLHFYVIDGNHDLSSKGSEAVSSLRSLEHFRNVRWISYQSKGEAVHQIDDGRLAFIPFFPGMDTYIKKTKADVLISHFGLNEGMLSSGISIQSSIKAKDLKKYKLVVLGHYHLPQAMLYHSTYIYYVGSPVQLDWGEKNEEKRFLIIDTESPEDVESVLTGGYKKYMEFQIDASNKDKTLSEVKVLRDEGHHIKLVTSEKLDLDPDMKNINIVDNSEEDITNRGITAGMTEIDKNTKYLDIKEVSAEDREEYLNVAKEIMDSATIPD